MIESKTPVMNIETYENKPEVVLESNKRIKYTPTKANSKKGIIIGLISKFRNDAIKGITYSPKELEILFTDRLIRLNKINKEIPITIVEGWKGLDTLDIWKGVTNDFLIESHTKDKETNEITTLRHTILNEDVNKIIKFIRTWKINESHSCYDFAEVLGFKDWKSLWKERKIYFKEYYYPIKILERLKLIKYSGRGKITKLK